MSPAGEGHERRQAVPPPTASFGGDRPIDGLTRSVRAGLGPAFRTGGRILKGHSLPFVLLGAGATWLALDLRRSRSHPPSAVSASTGVGVHRRTHQRPPAVGRNVTPAAETPSGSTVELSRAASANPGHRRPDEHAPRERAAAEGIRDAVRRSSRHVRLSFWQAMESGPLTIGAATLGAGILLGLALPPTGAEDAAMGTLGEKLRGRARDAAALAAGRAAHNLAGTIRDEISHRAQQPGGGPRRTGSTGSTTGTTPQPKGRDRDAAPGLDDPMPS